MEGLRKGEKEFGSLQKKWKQEAMEREKAVQTLREEHEREKASLKQKLTDFEAQRETMTKELSQKVKIIQEMEASQKQY